MFFYEVIHIKKWIPRHLGFRISDLELRNEKALIKQFVSFKFLRIH